MTSLSYAVIAVINDKGETVARYATDDEAQAACHADRNLRYRKETHEFCCDESASVKDSDGSFPEGG